MRFLVPALIAAALLGVVAGAARADGDPASDVLYVQDVFVPYPPPPKATVAALKRNVAVAFAKGYRLKVAVIASSTDLGAVPELFNKPKAYGKFLGQELGPIFVGPLVIVMPAGFGVYDGGRSTAAEERVLSGLAVSGSSADELTRSATVAVQKLIAARALRSKDIRPPQVYPQPTTGRRGTTVRLKWSVLDDSERTKDVVRISAGKALKAVLRTRLQTAIYSRPHSVQWLIPQSLKRGTLRYCVVAMDPTGNKNPSVCTQLRVT